MITAVSSAARPMPRITPLMMPLPAAGSSTWRMACTFVNPRLGPSSRRDSGSPARVVWVAVDHIRQNQQSHADAREQQAGFDVRAQNTAQKQDQRKAEQSHQDGRHARQQIHAERERAFERARARIRPGGCRREYPREWPCSKPGKITQKVPTQAGQMPSQTGAKRKMASQGRVSPKNSATPKESRLCQSRKNSKKHIRPTGNMALAQQNPANSRWLQVTVFMRSPRYGPVSSAVPDSPGRWWRKESILPRTETGRPDCGCPWPPPGRYAR